MKTKREVWRPVPSLPGVTASSWGRVKLPDKFGVPLPNGGFRDYLAKPRYGHETRSKADAAHIYMGLHAKDYGNIKVHQAICEAFHGPKPFEEAVVIHRNEDSTDNRSENVRWGTQRENLNAPGFIAYCKARTGDENPFVKGRAKQGI